MCLPCTLHNWDAHCPQLTRPLFSPLPTTPGCGLFLAKKNRHKTAVMLIPVKPLQQAFEQILDVSDKEWEWFLWTINHKRDPGGTLLIVYCILYIVDHIRFRLCDNLNVSHWQYLDRSCGLFKPTFFLLIQTLVLYSLVKNFIWETLLYKNAQLRFSIDLALNIKIWKLSLSLQYYV